MPDVITIRAGSNAHHAGVDMRGANLTSANLQGATFLKYHLVPAAVMHMPVVRLAADLLLVVAAAVTCAVWCSISSPPALSPDSTILI